MTRRRIASILNAAPDFATAGVFLVTWIAPATFGEQALKRLMLVMLLEFVVVHSAAFMGTVAVAPAGRAKRALGIVGFGAFYSLFAAAMGLAFQSWWPVIAFAGLTLNRLLGVLLGQVPDAEQKAFIRMGWVASVEFFVGGCFLTMLLPVPALGVTPAVVAAQHFSVTGLWIEEPQRVLAFGVVYFALTGWSDLASHTWAAKHRPSAIRASIRPKGGTDAR
jgi:hypothetical protein